MHPTLSNMYDVLEASNEVLKRLPAADCERIMIARNDVRKAIEKLREEMVDLLHIALPPHIVDILTRLENLR